MEKNKEQKQGYECEVCGATSDTAQSCCGQSMKKAKDSSLQNRTQGFSVEAGKQGNKK